MRRWQTRHQVLKHPGGRRILHASSTKDVAAAAGTDKETCVVQRQRGCTGAKVTPLSVLTKELFNIGEVECRNSHVNTLEIGRHSPDGFVAAKIANDRYHKISRLKILNELKILLTPKETAILPETVLSHHQTGIGHAVVAKASAYGADNFRWSICRKAGAVIDCRSELVVIAESPADTVDVSRRKRKAMFLD